MNNQTEKFPKPLVFISRIVFTGGNSFSFKADEKIIIVGPNNSGKSQALREIFSISDKGSTGPQSSKGVVVSELELQKNAKSDALRLFLDTYGKVVNGHYRYKDWQFYSSNISAWDRDFLTSGLAAGFIKNIAPADRLEICNLQDSIGIEEHPFKPQHILYDDSSLMSGISKLFRNAFDKDIMFDYRGGKNIPIHVGEIPSLSVNPDRASDNYVGEVRKNPRLDQQGDGIKSYAGILFESIVVNRDITLIDEPEAFLHPPQMRRLGETLSSKVNKQLFIATHSSDILKGFLEGTKGNIRILRIWRDSERNYVAEASAASIKELWEKPELRYSNALDGIFHEQAIICEDDSDCRLINSIADHIAAQTESAWKDTAYIPTGGKHGVPKIASVLRNIGVPVKVIFDIDFLSEESLVKASVEAFGGDWGDIKPSWKIVDAAVRGGEKPKSKAEIKNDIINIINSAKLEDLPKSDIEEAMKQTSPWHKVKKYGYIAIPGSEGQRSYVVLKNKLEGIGIYLIPVGEIEKFCPTISGHGPKFVTGLLTEMDLSDENLEPLRKFVELVHKGNHSIQINLPNVGNNFAG